MKILVTAIMLAILPITGTGQVSADTIDTDEQTELRLAPQIDGSVSTDYAPPSADYAKYPSLKLKNKHISLNGDDWFSLSRQYASALAGDTTFTIVYLGDSHVQADFGGRVLRHRMAQGKSGGRGLIIPFKLAGTNQPTDYSISTGDNLLLSKLMRRPWSIDMPFTGIGIKPLPSRHSLKITTGETASRLRFHTRGTVPSVRTVRADGIPVHFHTYTDSDGLCTLTLSQPANSFDISMSGDGTTVYGGIEMLDADNGIVTHSIGNNGATFSSYNMLDDFGSGIGRLHPDLIVVALGTNEAFGRAGTESTADEIRMMISTLRRHCPSAKILLAGPTDCYRRQYTRRRRRRSSHLVPNTRIAPVARTIRTVSADMHIPYLNQYAIGGSAASMRQAHILGSDGIHFTVAGYQLWGNILSDAILEQLQP